VQQKGSLVTPERTRFDFAHNAPVSDAQIAQVEALVNAEILANAATQARVMTIDEAQKSGALMLFGEKYGETVRVLDIGSSRELCGGTHVQRSGDIGVFKIVAETGIAAGIRRVEAVTGDNALAYLQQLEATMAGVAAVLKATPAEVPARVHAVLDHVRALEKELTALKGRLASAQGDDLLAQAVDVKGLKVLAAMLPGAEDGLAVKELRVLLVDDHPLFLDGMRTLLTAHGVQVVGMAHDGVEAQELAAELQPALILMDVHMPVCDGLEATRRIHAGWPAIKIVMLTLAADEASLYQAMAAGAWGYLLKNMNSVTFVRALAEIVRGEVSLTPALAAQILTAFPTPACSESGTALSEQQVRVLELVARGLLYKEVARALAISEATVKYHMGQIVDHLHVKNRAEAVAIARQRWLIERT